MSDKKKSFLSELKAILRRDHEVSEDETFDELEGQGLDSMSKVEIVMAADELYGKNIEGKPVKSFGTVGKLLEFLEGDDDA